MVAQAALVLPSDCMAADRIKCAVALRRLTYFGKDGQRTREKVVQHAQRNWSSSLYKISLILGLFEAMA